MCWPMILSDCTKSFFAHSAFKWRNLAAKNAGVTVVSIGIANDQVGAARLFESSADDEVIEKAVHNIKRTQCQVQTCTSTRQRSHRQIGLSCFGATNRLMAAALSCLRMRREKSAAMSREQ